MSFLVNDPATFVEDMVKGFVIAHPDLVRSVSGGIVRKAGTTVGQVAIVIGGGSGHYPAFAGLVGPGLAHGAAMGNVFASPSARQVYSVAVNSDSGAGVLLMCGNYAGDVLNFRQAKERLLAEGIPSHIVLVTDDVSSADVTEIGKRRGVAGDLFVFKVAAAAAEAGGGLDEVAAIAEHANDRTRTLGVAFSGCTLPGADQPLFTVPRGRMGVGMGIHGEPGIEEADVPSADELADMLVGRLLRERPTGADRVVPLVNGLGSVKSEELYVLFGSIADRLSAAGASIVEPEVGELVTSFEMAGVSLTLSWLDEELERLWSAPALSAAYCKGAVRVTPSVVAESITPLAPARPETVLPAASAVSRNSARFVVAALTAVKDIIDAEADELGRLDAIAGDGDHGIGMQRGADAALIAARAAVEAGAGVGTALCRAADAWADKAGGTSGVLWGILLRSVGERLGDLEAPDVQVVAEGIAAGNDAVQKFGQARPGDKTLVDVLHPFSQAYAERAAESNGIADAWTAAAAVAERAARETSDLTPRTGRARPHAEKSRGTPDPGAVSLALAIAAVQSVLNEKEGNCG